MATDIPMRGYFPIAAPTFTQQQQQGSVQQPQQTTQETYEQYQNRMAQEAKPAIEARLREVRLAELRSQTKEVVDTINTQINDSVTSLNTFKKNIRYKNGKYTADSGVKGSGRWGSNLLTTLCNVGKGLVGYDENGKWSFGKLLGNIVSIGVGAAICCIPGGAYALAAYGLISGGIEMSKGKFELDKAKRKGDQAAIDEAQQKICGGGIMAATSILGSGVLGRVFRTGITTAGKASAAAQKTSWTGKAGEAISNFGRDITVNAWRAAKTEVAAAKANGGMWQATKNNFNNGMLKRFSWGKKNYDYQYNQLKTNLTSKLNEIEAKLATETDTVQRALLQEEKNFIQQNLSDFNRIGVDVKTQAEFKQLGKDNYSQFNREYVQAYAKTPDGKYNVEGVMVDAKDFATFQRRILQEQKSIGKALDNLTNSKANMMRYYGYRSKKHQAELDEYVSIDGVGKKFLKPSTWFKSKYQIAIDGKNPSYVLKSIGALFASPALTGLRANNIQFNPIYSDPIMLTQEMLPDQIKQIIQQSQSYIDAKKQILSAIENAKTEEEFAQAISANQQYDAALAQQASGGQNPEQQAATGGVDGSAEQQAASRELGVA